MSMAMIICGQYPRCSRTPGKPSSSWYYSHILADQRSNCYDQDWWLTPELYLRRPPAHYPEWRLDRVLKRKAEQGVKIHVIVYKEVHSIQVIVRYLIANFD